MTALVINGIIGAGIFALPGELNRLLGRASPFAMIFAAVAMVIIMACIAEVASQFSEPGGAYLYTRTAFGRFVGMQIGWFFLLAVVGAVAVAANLFVDYLAPLLPWRLNAWERGLVMGFVIAIPTAANYCGVRSGANLSTVMTLAKVSPLVLLIVSGVRSDGTKESLDEFFSTLIQWLVISVTAVPSLNLITNDLSLFSIELHSALRGSFQLCVTPLRSPRSYLCCCTRVIR